MKGLPKLTHDMDEKKDILTQLIKLNIRLQAEGKITKANGYNFTWQKSLLIYFEENFPSTDWDGIIELIYEEQFNFTKKKAYILEKFEEAMGGGEIDCDFGPTFDAGWVRVDNNQWVLMPCSIEWKFVKYGHQVFLTFPFEEENKPQ